MDSELVDADDVSSLILWTNIFLEAQGYEFKQKVYTKIIKALSYYRKMVKVVRLKGQDI